MTGPDTRDRKTAALESPAGARNESAGAGPVRGRGSQALDLPGVLGNPVSPGKSNRAPGAAPTRRVQARPGSVRQSVLTLAAVGVGAVVLLGVVDGLVAAGLGLAVVVGAGLGIARFAAGAGARDSGHRRPVRLLGGSEPVLGGWQWLVHNALGADGDAYFAERLRPQLQRLFAARLAAGHGTDLYRAPERARALVGDDLWPWIDPSQPPPERAIPPAVLRALVARLDALDDVAAPRERR